MAVGLSAGCPLTAIATTVPRPADPGQQAKPEGCSQAWGIAFQGGGGEAQHLAGFILLIETGCEEAASENSRGVTESGNACLREGGHQSDREHAHAASTGQPDPPPSCAPQPCTAGWGVAMARRWGTAARARGAAGSEAPLSHPGASRRRDKPPRAPSPNITQTR